MEIITSRVDFSYACSELARGLRDALPTIDRIAREVAAEHQSVNRVLIVVKCCPCCCDLQCDVPDDAIIVSPLAGIDPSGYRDRIHRVNVYPPFTRDNGDKEGATMAEFEKHWRKTVQDAIKDASA